MKKDLEMFIKRQMLGKLNESEELLEEELFEDSDDEEKKDVMSDEDLNIESLKIATNVAKLMSGVTTDDILEIAKKISGFIRNHEIGNAEGEESDENLDDLFPSDEEESEKSSTEETSEESSTEQSEKQ